MVTTYAAREETADCRAAWSWGSGDVIQFVPARHAIWGCITRPDSVLYPFRPHRVSYTFSPLFSVTLKTRILAWSSLTVNRAAEIATGMICSCLPAANIFVTQILKKGFKWQKDHSSSTGQDQDQILSQSQQFSLRMHNLSQVSSESRTLERTATAARLASIVEQDALGLFDMEPCRLTTSIRTSRRSNELHREQKEGEQEIGTGIQINMSVTQTIEDLRFVS